MTIAYLTGKKDALADARVAALFRALSDAGYVTYPVACPEDLREGTGMLLSIGGDGTFLNCARIAVSGDIPVLGVNLGRLGFLSEYKPEDVADAILSGEFSVEEREMLHVSVEGADCSGIWPYALNEVTVHRIGPNMLGVDARVGDSVLPTYWADGLLVATSSGSTAYSLSVGGPICTPDVRAHIIAPIAPHNLNMRPLVVPDSCPVRLELHSRDGRAMLTMDNRHLSVPNGTAVGITPAECRLKRVALHSSSFISVLRSRLFWGEEVRNSREKDL